MKSLWALLISFTILTCNCNNYNYSKAVRQDTERIFNSQKDFFYNLEIKGIIFEKEFCKTCKVNKYSLIVEIGEKISQGVLFKNKQYPPYYMFFEKNKLKISVCKTLYDAVSKGDSIKKEGNSRIVLFNNKEFAILSKEEKEWLPCPG